MDDSEKELQRAMKRSALLLPYQYALAVERSERVDEGSLGSKAVLDALRFVRDILADVSIGAYLETDRPDLLALAKGLLERRE